MVACVAPLIDCGRVAYSSIPASQIFFDDNIERDRAHIIDVRDAHTFAPVPFTTSRGVCIRRVAPLLAIRDPAYFIKEVDEVLGLVGLSQSVPAGK